MSELRTLLATEPHFSIWFTLMQQAGLLDLFEQPEAYTLFVPHNDAWHHLPPIRQPILEQPESLQQLLLNHIVTGHLVAADLMQIDHLTTLRGDQVAVSHDQGLRVNGAFLLAADLIIGNRVIHTIDHVMV